MDGDKCNITNENLQRADDDEEEEEEEEEEEGGGRSVAGCSQLLLIEGR